jgi:HEAT repeat protein
MDMSPEQIEQMLDSGNYGDRLKALNHIRKLPTADAFGLLLRASGDSNARVRYAAISQLGSLGMACLEQDRPGFDRATAVMLLRDRLAADPEIDVKAAAADSLGALRCQEAYEDLERAYRGTKEWLLQFSIIAALAEVGEPRAYDLLVEALQSPVDLVQTAAVTALGELSEARSVPHLLPFVTSDDWQMRFRVAQALARIGTPDTQAALTQLAQDSVEQVAQAAVPSGS